MQLGVSVSVCKSVCPREKECGSEGVSASV